MNLKIIKPIVLVAIAIFVPAAIAYALSSPEPNRPIGILMVGLLEVLGFSFLVLTLRPQPLTALVTAFLYFPLTFILIFQIGILGGYYDYP